MTSPIVQMGSGFASASAAVRTAIRRSSGPRSWVMRRLAILLPLVAITVLAAPTASAIDLVYWIEPCTRAETSCQPQDPQLAAWALDAWAEASGGGLHFTRTERIELAHIRVHWASAEQGQYGEMRPFRMGNISGAQVYVRPDLSAMGPDIFAEATRDPLLRDAIVYLTCLHETGHAVGLSHTADFPDIMYSFQFGGDIPEYFGRYRRLLKQRTDIADHAGISQQDRLRLAQSVARMEQ